MNEFSFDKKMTIMNLRYKSRLQINSLREETIATREENQSSKRPKKKNPIVRKTDDNQKKKTIYLFR